MALHPIVCCLSMKNCQPRRISQPCFQETCQHSKNPGNRSQSSGGEAASERGQTQGDGPRGSELRWADGSWQSQYTQSLVQQFANRSGNRTTWATCSSPGGGSLTPESLTLEPGCRMRMSNKFPGDAEDAGSLPLP